MEMLRKISMYGKSYGAKTKPVKKKKSVKKIKKATKK
jgi:hypothetical protein